MKNRLVIAGGSGFLGRALAKHFTALDWDIVLLSRSPGISTPGFTTVPWDGKQSGEWTAHLENATAVINLCGQSVNCRYTPANRRKLLDSRVLPTRVLGQALTACQNPPRIWLNASSATLYKHTLTREMSETGEQGATPEARDAFSIDVIRLWESEFWNHPTPGTRKVTLRTAMVLGLDSNSVAPTLRCLTLLGLGGKMGTGQQYVSWIHVTDFVRAVEWILQHEEVSGAINLVAPKPLRNLEMMSVLRQLCGVPIGLPAPEWLLEVGAFLLRTETELILKSRRVIPAKLQASGFRFQFEDFRSAMEDLFRQQV